MKKIVLLGLFLLLTFIVIVIVKMPASFVLSHAAKQSNMFYLDTIQGSLWQGSAENVQVKLPAGILGRRATVLQLGSVNWSLSFWQLLMANAAIQLQTKHVNQSLETTMDISLLSESVKVGETWFKIDLSFATTFYPVPAKIKGEAEVNLQSLFLELADNRPIMSNLVGQVLVSQLEIAVTAPVELGDFGVNISSDDEGVITALLSDVNATVGVSGKGTFDQATKAYTANGEVTPTAKTNNMVTQALRFIATPQSNGSFVINQSGSL